MSQALYTDSETGSEIRQADEGSYQVVDGDGSEIALVEPEQADEIASLMADLLDDTVSVDGRPGPEGDGWKLGQIGFLGMHMGFAFFNPENQDEAAEFHGREELAETFVEVFGQ